MIVVSEETGIVSMARDGMLRRPLTVDELREILNDLYTKKKGRLSTLIGSLKTGMEEESAHE